MSSLRWSKRGRRALARLALGLLCYGLLLPAWAQAPALRLCQPDQSDYPWTLPDRPGLNNLLISRAAARVGLRVQYLPMPWARCLFKLSAGEVDGAFNASYNRERAGMAVFPFKNGKPDPQRRLMRSGYTLYQRRGEPLAWNGRRLRVSGPIGIPNGYTAMAFFLREQGASVDQHLKYGNQLLQALTEGDYEAVALKTGEGQYLLRRYPAFSRRVVAVSPPLSQRDFYLIFSHAFMRQRGPEGERLWQAMAEERATPAWRAQQRAFR